MKYVRRTRDVLISEGPNKKYEDQRRAVNKTDTDTY